MHKRVLTFTLFAAAASLGCADDTVGGADSETGATETGDGDGDPTTGDGDGDPTTGDGDGDTPAVCGDGVVGGDEECDDGNADNTDACTDACLDAVCGDGYVQAGIEACDDGNDVDDDGCSNACVLDTCGDGVVDEGEACDDGNDDDTDDCVSCMAATCGDGAVWAGMEECDDGNEVDSDDCIACVAATCGDGFVIEGVEACDDGNEVDTDACPTTCAAAVCGDGFVYEGMEECDDGNLDDDDGCSATCTAECDEGLLACNQACVDPNIDEGNCGECGNTCGEDQFCSAGDCVALKVLVLGATGVVGPLQAAGYTVDSLAYGDSANAALASGEYAVAVIGRYAFNWPVVTAELTAAIEGFNQAGGAIVTEWDGVSMFFSGYHPTYRYPNGALSLSWYAGTVGGGQSRGSSTPITQVVPEDPLFANVSNPFSAAGATDFFFTMWDVDASELELLATFPGNGTANFPDGDLPCIYRGARCGANVIFASFDYQDDAANAGFGDLMPNLIEAAIAPTSPNVVDVCN